MKKIDILSLARGNVLQMKPYASARDEFSGEATVWLDANENPYPADFNRYPDPHQARLKQFVSECRPVTPEQVFIANGSDEAIDLLIRVFCIPSKDNVVIPRPTYGMYATCAAVNDVEVISPAFTGEFQLRAESVIRSITPATKLIFLCSPNNPTGNLLSRIEIEYLLDRFNGIVIIDEAYIDFSRSESWVERLAAFDNLVILQTFSKAWGLAGLRIGICIAHREIISLMNKIKLPYNVNSFSQAQAAASLAAAKTKRTWHVREIIANRMILSSCLRDHWLVKNVFPSDANFLLIKVAEPKLVFQKLAAAGIIVRDRSDESLCDGCLRITVGTREENDLLLQTLDRI